MGTIESRESGKEEITTDNKMTTKRNSMDGEDSYPIGTGVGPSKTVSRRLQHIKSFQKNEGLYSPNDGDTEDLKIEPLDSDADLIMPDSGEKDGDLIQLYQKLKYSSVYNSIKKTKKNFVKENTTVMKMMETVSFNEKGDFSDVGSNGRLCVLMGKHDIGNEEEITWYATQIQSFFWVMYSWRDKLSDYLIWCMYSNLKNLIIVCAQLEAFLNNNITNLPKESNNINIATAQINEMIETRMTKEKTKGFKAYTKALISKNMKDLSIYNYTISRLKRDREEKERIEQKRRERIRQSTIPLKKKDKFQKTESSNKSESEKKDKGETRKESKSLLGWNFDNFKNIVFGSDEGGGMSDKKD